MTTRASVKSLKYLHSTDDNLTSWQTGSIEWRHNQLGQNDITQIASSNNIT